MAKKKFKITDPLFLSFIVLIILGLGLTWLNYGQKFFGNKNKPYLTDKVDLISKIEIKEQSRDSILEKKGQQWIVTTEDRLPAEKEKIEALIAALAKLTKEDLVSKNEKNYQNYGLDERQAISLKIYQEDNLLFQALIGKAGPTFDKDYFRLPEEKEVYLTNVSLRNLLIQPTWRNLIITNFYSDQVKEIEVSGKLFSNKDDQNFKTLVGEFTNLRGENALNLEANDRDKLGLNSPLISLKIRLEKEDVEIKIGAEKGTKRGEESYYLEKNSENVAYQITKSKFDNITASLKSLSGS